MNLFLMAVSFLQEALSVYVEERMVVEAFCLGYRKSASFEWPSTCAMWHVPYLDAY